MLNLDGSTRANDAQPGRKGVLEDLRSCQLRNAKKQIKKQTLRQVAFDSDSELPETCRDPVAIVALYLETDPNKLDISSDCRDEVNVPSLLALDIDEFYSKLPMLMSPFANVLSLAVRDLRMLLKAGNGAGFASTEVSQFRANARTRSTARPQNMLSSQVRSQLDALRKVQFSELPAARTLMAATAAEVLARRAAVLERTVTLLERTKHGVLGRATKAKAEHFNTVAHGVEGKLKVMRLDLFAAIHTPQITAALTRYHQHLRETRERLDERREHALNELKAYEEVDSGTHRGPANSGPIVEIARRYGALIRDIEEVKTEIQRLRC